MKKNNWYVITGAPYAGKTTVLELLGKKGHRVIYEAARIYIDEEMGKGRTLEQIRQDELLFQEKVLKFKIELERALVNEEMIFFDRAIPDSEAYYSICGVTNDDYLKQALNSCSYKKVFLFDYLPYKKDYARTESQEQQIKIHELLEETYQKIKAPLIKVPVLKTIEERLNIVLNNL